MGAGITWLKNNGFFTADYYPYNSGGLLSVKTSKKINTGKNFTDIADNTIAGAGYVIGGFPVAINSDNSILPSGNYVFSFDVQNATFPCACQLIWYRNGVEVGNTVENISASGINSIAFTASGKFDSIVMFCNSSSGGAFTNFNLNIGSTPLAYEPYVSHEYPLDGSRKVHRVFGIVDLGTLDYTYYGGRFNTVSAFNDIGGEIVSDYYVNVICAKYVNSSSGNDKTFFVYNNKYIYIYDSDYTDATAFKNSLDGVYLVYELATPFDETVSNPELRGILKLDSNNKLYYYGDTCNDFTNPMQVDGNGTEEFVDGRTVEMPVGHESYYADIYDISGFTQLKLNHTGQEVTVAFGQTVYGGVLDVLSGKLTVTKGYINLSTLDPATLGSSPVFYAQLTNVKVPASNSDIAEVISEAYTPIRYNGVAGTVNTVAINTSGYIYVNTGSALIIPTGIAIFTLATPVEIQLTAHQLETILGQNTLSHNCNGDTEVKYYTGGVSVIKDLIDATPIDDLSNVSISSPTNNQILTYNSTSSKWENKAPVVDSSLSSTSTNPVQNKVIDTALDGKADKATTYTKTEVNDIVDLVKTASGNPCSFSTNLADNLVSLTADVVCSQDLHGYDHPWAAGGGKNKLPPYTFSSGGGINITSNNGTYNISGTTTGYFQLIAPTSFILKAGTYTLNSNGSNTNSLSVQLRSADGLTTYAESALNSDTFTLNADTEVKFRITFNNANSYSATISPQLELGLLATPFEPYSNICPIVGISSLDIIRCGINLWDEETESGRYNTSTGNKESASNYICSSNRITVKEGTTYTLVKPIGLFMQPVYYNNDGTFNSAPDIIHTQVEIESITIPSEVGYLCFNILAQTYGNNISFNYPATDTTYHAYNGTPYLVSFGQTVYGCVLDVLNSKLTLTHKMRRLADLNWMPNSSFANIFNTYEVTDRKRNKVWSASDGDLCNLYKGYTSNDIVNYNCGIAYGMGMDNAVVYCKDIRCSTVEEFVQQMTTDDGMFTYQLATPIEIDVSELSVDTIVGVNNIISDGGGDVEVQYEVGDLANDVKTMIGNSNLSDLSDIPNPPTTDGNYRLKVTILDGKATYSWEEITE